MFISKIISFSARIFEPNPFHEEGHYFVKSKGQNLPILPFLTCMCDNNSNNSSKWTKLKNRGNKITVSPLDLKGEDFHH